MTPTVLICGGREFGNIPKDKTDPTYEKKKLEYNFIMRQLDGILCFDRRWVHDEEYMMPKVKIIAGGARGVDSAAIDWAVVNWVPFQEFKADWENHGKAAGPIRNSKMLEEGKPDLVVAFPGGNGTAHMVKIAKAKGVEVIEVVYNE